MNRLLLSGILFMMTFQLSIAQRKGWSFNAWKAEGWISAADKAAERGDYYAAFRYLESAATFDSTRIEVWQKYAWNALQFHAYPHAENAFRKSVELSGESDDIFWLAYAIQRQGKYEEAMVLYDELRNSGSELSPVLRNRIDYEMANCRFGKERLSQSIATDIHQMDTATINTPYAEYGLYELGDSLYFSSQRVVDKKDNHIPDRYFSRLFFAMDDEPMGYPMDKSFNAKGKYIAHPTFSPDQSRIYYAICNFVDDINVRCDLVMREKTTAGKWGKVQVLNISDPAFTHTHPSLGIDKNSGRELLFFSSDRPGGKGGLDLWYALLDKEGMPTEPINASFANTPGDEVSPFFFSQTQTLYFSSDGLPTLGGFDIYHTKNDGDIWQAPQHLPFPVNTSYEDLFYTRFDCDRAYLSSNRPGSLLLDEASEACCTDLYRVAVPTGVELDITAFNTLTDRLLNGVAIQIFEQSADGEILVGQVSEAAALDTFKLMVDRCKEYRIQSVKSGYGEVTLALDLINFSLNGQPSAALEGFLQAKSEYEYPKMLQLAIPLMPQTANLQVRVFDVADSSIIYGATTILTLKEVLQGEIPLREVKINERDAASVFSIQAERSYSIDVQKMGFEPGYAEFVISQADIEALGQDLVVDFYLKRESFADLLPINLYFDNNLPRAHPDTATTQSYASLFNNYVREKVNYIESFNSDPTLSDIDKDRNIRGYDNFFDREVRLGFDSLEILVSKLAEYLERTGSVFEIQLVGSASPIGDAYYNMLLSARRVSSVYNYLMEAQGGVLEKYVAGGQLIVHRLYTGEAEASEAARRISENLRDRRNAVYNVVACVERRVTIKAFIKE